MSYARKLIAVSIMALMLVSLSALAEVPQMTNYQGRLTDSIGVPVADGPYQINFKIYGSAAGNDSLWWSGFQSVQVTDGLFEYQLGSTAPLPDNLFSADTMRYLGITVGSDPELTPRVRLISIPYAYQALRADSTDYAFDIADGSIVDADINPSANIATSKISGTAVNLNSTQAISGVKTFTGDVYFGDSTMRANNNGIVIGSNSNSPSSTYLVNARRDYNTTSNRTGYNLTLNNQGTGGLTGIMAYVSHTGPAGGNGVQAIATSATSDADPRAGFYAYVDALNPSITTGTSYGLLSTARDGLFAYGVYTGGYSATNNYGIYAACHSSTGDYGGYFYGNLHATGSNTKASGGFKIDHPLDPENRYLIHSDVESPEMKNVYDGVVRLDASGRAIVELPDYFEALNGDFRYQLTCLGRFAPVYIAEEISDNRFVIAGGEPYMEISWMVTGIRRDAYAESFRMPVEIAKPEAERGLYMHPAAFGIGEDRQIHFEQNRKARQDSENVRYNNEN